MFDIANEQYIETPWNIIESYFRGQHLERFVRHQLESYNNFVGYQIIKTIEMFNPVHIASEQDFDPVSKKYSLEIYISFENFHIYRPQIHENNGAIKLMFPQEARLRNFTYASSTTIDINIKYIVRNGPNLENIQTFYKTIPKIHIGKLPIMLKSNICVLNQYKHFENTQTGECKFDAGGYFIINGSEKTVLGQERAAENRVYCFNISKNETKYTWKAEVKSVPDFKCISPKAINMMVNSKNNGFGNSICLEIPRVKQPIPLFIVFRALGVISDKEICEKILLDINSNKNKEMIQALQASIIEANTYITQEECIKYITGFVMYIPINMDKETGAKKKHDFTLEILNNDLFPHCHTINQKIYYLGYMANRLLMASFEIIKTDDRDSYLNKRIDLTGSLLNNLYRNYFNKLVKDMEKQIIREINTGSWKSTDDYENIINLTNVYKIIKSTTIENGLKRALSTGDFGIKHTNSNKVGVAQVLNRLNYVSSLSHARRISTPTDKSGKLIPPRKLHNTSWGYLCPAECFDPETEILMWDASIKRAGDIVVGDILVDDLGNPTTVRTTCSGLKNMYDVIPDKPNFLKHRVTDNHILTLKIRGSKRDELIYSGFGLEITVDDDDTLDITIENYLKLDIDTKMNLVLFKQKHTDESKFNLVEAGEGPYVGWQLHDKRGRFCLKDGLVVHNTPEGQSVGVVKNLSYMAHITIYSSSIPLYEYIMPNITPIDKADLDCIDLYDKTKVFINGSWVGITENPIELYELLKDKKYKGIINIYTSIVFDYKLQEIRICNDSGRLTRPLLRVKNKNLLITNDIIDKLNKNELVWDNLLTSSTIDNSIIEYIDPEEQSWSLIATKPRDIIAETFHIHKYSHCEIHPSTIFGVLASCIPFPEHNQSPRNTYQCAQGKQAMGVYVTNYENRMDKTAYVLNYPMRPLVDTRIMNMIQLNKIPSGSQLIVAIMTYTGYNQEDSLLLNQGSIDRGMALTTIYHTEKDEDKQKINGDEEIRCKPDATKTKGMKMGNYNKVNSKGVIPENTLIENRDIIISKVTPIKENRNDHTKVIKYEDQSRMYKTVEETYIDKNYIDRNGEGYNFAKVRLRALRKPVIGDKFSSRHGQKGTVGNIIPECDMPFTTSGIKPDIIINPHAIPSRMTIGQLKETVLGKVLVELGLFGDGTSFGEYNVKDICDELIKVGYEAHGNELLYNGLTGEQHECSVFMGPVFYQRLKHMVNDKAHSRSIGPMVNLTRQPAEGRSRDGGLRFGEMERDCESGDTPIVTTNGLSVLIKNMENCDNEVLGWDEKTGKMIPSKQIGFLYKGERDCIKLTFEDGRTNICTPEHPVLTSDNKWIKAKDLVVNNDRVKASITCPVVDFMDEIKECNGWSLKVGDLRFKTDTIDNYKKTLVFAKLIGYLITDGYISKNKGSHQASIFLGHMIDVNSFVNDLKLLCNSKQINYKRKNLYEVRIPASLLNHIIQIKGIPIGKKVIQPAILPEFILDENCPKPIIREFLGGLFGGDGHTCVLGMHRGKRDILSSISFSKSKIGKYKESLTQMMNDIKNLLAKLDIHKVTIQNFKETTSSKKKLNDSENKSYQLTLHLDIDELIPFSEKIGFRYCCHKSQRLEAGVSYKRLRNEVTRQHNWLVAKVDELTKFSEIKKEHPDKIVPTKKAIEQAVKELEMIEPLIHKYAIPSTHDITDHLIKGTQFGKFTSKSFPTAEEYLKEIGALDWFLTPEPNKSELDDKELLDDDDDKLLDAEDDIEESSLSCYGVNRECDGIPTMELKIIDIRPAGIHPVYDIEVENTHSFLANGIVAHNCMVSHGASRFTRGRMYNASDKYSVHICKKCGLIASYNDKMHIHHCRTCDNRTDFAYVEIPYACKLLFQELNTMNIAPRLLTEN
jgi:DNA-directed RNA polymerase beta subunit/intein/homing endonuclease